MMNGLDVGGGRTVVRGELLCVEYVEEAVVKLGVAVVDTEAELFPPGAVGELVDDIHGVEVAFPYITVVVR